jgi:hypothetical protein
LKLKYQATTLQVPSQNPRVDPSSVLNALEWYTLQRPELNAKTHTAGGEHGILQHSCPDFQQMAVLPTMLFITVNHTKHPSPN